MNLKKNTEHILFSEDNFDLIKKGIDNLYELWSKETGIFADHLTNEKMFQTENGLVVTPVHAAHCLKDLARTTHFLRGIHKAIEHFLKNKKQIRILYAGCGPYATLLTPFTSMYSPEQIHFTFLEIEEVSLHAVNKLYSEWHLTPYLDEVRLADATDPDIQFPKRFDIIISETMQVGLKNECQVPITRNLVRFLEEGGTFIPQQIKLDIYLTGEKQDPLIADSYEKLWVGTAYNLDFQAVPEPGYETTLTIPQSNLEFLKLYTTIHLFGNEKLTAYQSGLTLPLVLDKPVNKVGQQIKFWYEEGARPKLNFKYISEELTSNGNNIPTTTGTMKQKMVTSSEHGNIPVNHLKRYWSKAKAQRAGSPNQWKDENSLDRALLDCLGLGLEPTIRYLYQTDPSFPDFEAWIKTQTNLSERARLIEQYNQLFEQSSETHYADFLSNEDLRFFDKQGYLIIRQAISKKECAETVNVIANYLDIDLRKPETWYRPHPAKQGIMVQLFRHVVLERNRFSPKIRRAYECLWKNQNLWVTTDRVGFNPPETESWKFPGPHLHLDIQPGTPLPFGLQGILYLTVTKENQGAFTLIPGFHKKIEQWMNRFDPDNIPLNGVFDEFERKPIAANAGDFIIWHHGLPHGSSANRHTQPRIVQYINWYPVL